MKVSSVPAGLQIEVRSRDAEIEGTVLPIISSVKFFKA